MRKQQLVCTIDREDGWFHSITNNHHHKTITLHINRDHGKTVHPMNGKKWKYGRAKDQMKAQDAIKDLTDKIGLMVGSLAVYAPKSH